MSHSRSRKNVIDTLLIVMVVIFLFLGRSDLFLSDCRNSNFSHWRIVLMQLFGFSLNLLTLLAIVLSVGWSSMMPSCRRKR